MKDRPAYIGFPVQVLGRGGLKSHDGRRWKSELHLRVSLGYLRDLFAYLDETAIRLSFHPSQFIVLNAPDKDLPARSAADVEVQSAILEAVGLDDEAVVVLHIGGLYGDREATRERFARNFENLSSVARRRLVLENDDGRFGVEDVLWLHERIGVRAVFDTHHHLCHNPTGIDLVEAARAFLVTWKGWDARPNWCNDFVTQ